jgi:pyrroline-5-carboxylate reductase
MKVSFIGGGNMGEAILAALIRQDLCQAGDITVHDASPARMEWLVKTYAISSASDNSEAIAGADVVVLAVKPQNLGEVMAELKGKLNPGQLVLSIVAGKNMATLAEGLEHRSIVRAMPNTPAQIGKGITVWTAMPLKVSAAQREKAVAILSVMGEQVYVGYETYLDMATAVSGSGPAYVFLFMEHLTAAAVKIGLPAEMARLLVMQTVLGSAAYAAGSQHELSELRRMVTSPGGTTAAALKVFEEGRLDELTARAVEAAFCRAKELGSQGVK